MNKKNGRFNSETGAAAAEKSARVRSIRSRAKQILDCYGGDIEACIHAYRMRKREHGINWDGWDCMGVKYLIDCNTKDIVEGMDGKPNQPLEHSGGIEIAEFIVGGGDDDRR